MIISKSPTLMVNILISTYASTLTSSRAVTLFKSFGLSAHRSTCSANAGSKLADLPTDVLAQFYQAYQEKASNRVVRQTLKQMTDSIYKTMRIESTPMWDIPGGHRLTGFFIRAHVKASIRALSLHSLAMTLKMCDGTLIFFST